jgi:hypothetical protein
MRTSVESISKINWRIKRARNRFTFGNPAALPIGFSIGLGQWLCVPPFRRGLPLSGFSCYQYRPMFRKHEIDCHMAILVPDRVHPVSNHKIWYKLPNIHIDLKNEHSMRNLGFTKQCITKTRMCSKNSTGRIYCYRNRPQCSDPAPPENQSRGLPLQC